MNKQRKIIRKMCAAGVVGILGANLALSFPTVKYTDKLEAEEYHAPFGNTDRNSIQQVVVPVTPVKASSMLSRPHESARNTERSTDGPNRSAKNTGGTNESGTVERINSSGGKKQNNVNRSGVTAIPEGSEGGSLNINSGSGKSDSSNGSGTSGKSNNVGGSGMTGKPNNTGGSGTSGKPDNANGSGTSGKTDSSNGSGISGKPNNANGSGTSGKPGSSDGADQPDNSLTPDLPGGTDHTNQPDGSDQSEKPDGSDDMNESNDKDHTNQPDGSDQSEESNETGNPGNPNDADDSDKPDESKDPSESDNPDESKDPSESGNPDEPKDPSESGNPDESKDPSESGKPDNSKDPITSGKPDNSKDPSASGKPNGTNNPEGSEKPDNSGGSSWTLDLMPGFGTNTSNEIIDADQFKPEKISPERIKNASLMLNQKLVKLPKLLEDYRFWTVARKYAFAKENLTIRESIVPEEGEDDRIRAVGKLRKNGLLYILKEEEDGWLYIESGRVRGFVRSEDIITGDDAGKQLKIYQEKAKKRAERLKQEYTGIEGTAPMALELLPWQENEAYTYLRATVGQTVVEKKYAIADVEDVEVMEDQDEKSRVIGIIPKGGLCFILEDEKEEWIYIESGDVRGFVKSGSIRFGEEVTEQVEENDEESFSLAEEKIKPEENRACYYTLTSTKPGVPSGEIRRSMVEFAAQFVGNPYVWGGTSLTQGADCSGFVQSIYKQYGYDLPRVSRDQAQYGTKIPIEDALPGDLIFYANNGNIYHVVMYAGEGKTIEAMSTDMGIVQADVSTDNAVWATRVLNDNGYEYAGGGISDVNATKDMYGENLGTFKLTYYCACEICCDVETGITATGAPVVEGRTIAVDPRVIPYGTQVIIGGHVFTAEDCGGAIKENRIDIYVNDHATALELGVNYADVHLKK